MAAWQHEFLLIPKVELRRFGAHLPCFLEPLQLEELEWWTRVQPPEGYLFRLDELLPKAVSWSASVLAWGHEDGDQICVVKNDDRVVEISARVDVRALDFDLVDRLADFGEYCDGAFLGTSGKAVAANRYFLLEEIQSGRAFAFVDNPEDFLRQLGQRKWHGP